MVVCRGYFFCCKGFRLVFFEVFKLKVLVEISGSSRGFWVFL